ncbi:MAG: hypothetical protein, partial [Olavius algarvensis Gamma 3 endosymbiont]
ETHATVHTDSSTGAATGIRPGLAAEKECRRTGGRQMVGVNRWYAVSGILAPGSQPVQATAINPATIYVAGL